jgi:phage baseplate assembly protein W
MALAPAPRKYDVLGVDLAMTKYVGVPSPAPLASADSWGSLDLQVAGSDLGALAGRANLAQALTLRLLTEQGALADLGHPDYGSKLISLIGRTNDQSARNLARLYVIEAVRQEARVRALTALAVTPVPGQPGTLRIDLTVTPINDADPLSLSLEVAL